MSDLPPDVLGREGRRRLYSRALGGAQGAPAPSPQAGSYNPLLSPGGPEDEGLRRAVMVHVLRTADLPQQGGAGFQPVPGIAAAGAPGSEDRVSTRIPWAKGTAHLEHGNPHRTSRYEIGLDAARASGDAFEKNAVEFRSNQFPDLPVRGLRNADAITRAAIDHMKQNLLHLHSHMVDRFGQDMVDRASLWYDGAHSLAHQWAAEHGKSPRQMAAAMAALSPQKDWFQNVSLANRVATILRDHQGTQGTVEMARWARDYIKAQEKKADTPTKRAALEELKMNAAAVTSGRSLREVNDPQSRAFWVRAYDEAHHSPDYNIVNPEGDFGDVATTAKGEPQKKAWGSFNEIGKAISALEGPDDLEHISRLLGGNHKVRSFYNNIIAPNHGHDVTIDTHAIAAAHLRPLAGEDFPVAMSLGLKGSSNAATGSKGTYGIVAHAYREAAKELGLLPRQLQSITWEGVRGLFSPEQKRDVAFFNHNYDLWHDFRRGKTPDADAVRQAIIAHAGDIDAPEWHPGGVIPREPETR